MPPKDIVARMMDIYKVQNVNWKLQMKIANQLLEKYSEEQIMYALKYYKTQSVNMYSLGYFTYKNNMDAPISMLKAMKNRTKTDDGYEQRNEQRIRQLRKTERREDYPLSLFTECEESS